ncbi:putative Zn-dependent peptidase [Abditibacterium utsteinense]|uniref:Putative Zn-dependent peptidase n=1 Tax=Abditibacterium utsteinense TaxID=1960156 RepID=A0A2S8SSQ5_9BACT|nr:pitrilysin family protein [Abditibacterium utsteinense]PQV63843.1 putative Zn-dependent peptidase [Abditibacterium utsteinense]
MKKSLLWGALCPTFSLLAAPSLGAIPATPKKSSATTISNSKTTAAPQKIKAKTVAATKNQGQAKSAAPRAFSSSASLEKLPNGVQFITRPDKLAPRVAISLVIRTGAAEETPETAGWRRFLVGAMLRAAPQGYATEKSDASPSTPQDEDLSRVAEKLGGSIGATVGDDFIEIYAIGDSQKAPELLDLALALWQKPRLSDEDLKAARESSQGQIDADDLDTASKTQAALRGQLFRDARGELSAYGLPDYGTDASLANLSDEKLRALQQSRFSNARLTVAASGDFDAAALREKLKQLPPRAGREPATPYFAAPKRTPALVVRELPIPSAWVFVSYPLAGDTQAEAPALRVLAAALGDSGAARLPARLLKNQPMGASTVASSVAAQFIPRRYAGELTVFAQTGPQNVERVKNALLDEIRRLRDAPLSKAELESAKTYARGSWSLERQNGRARAFQTALSSALGGPLDTAFPARLQSVTGAQVQNAAKKYLKSYAVALVMPGE